MISRAICMLYVIAMVVPAWSQTTKPTAEDQGQYIGEVTGTNVYVRSGPGSNAYPCTKLSKPATVSVVGARPGWLKILPPSEVFSVISKQYIRLDETGKAGVVTGKNIYVRSGGELCNWQNITGFSKLQLQLSMGAEVQVIGQAGDYYKISPPEGAYWWISEKYVKPTAKPIATEQHSPTSVADITKPVVSEETEEEIAATLKQFQEAEKLLQAEYKKPLKQRDIKSVLAKYKAIKVTDDSYIKSHVDARIEFLNTAMDQTKDMQAVEELVKRTAARQREYDLKRTRLNVERPLRQPITSFVAEGILKPSDLFTGSPASSRRFAVRDVMTGKVVAYAQSARSAVELESYIGKHVGILGTPNYDKNLALEVVEVDRVVVLSDQVKLPAPPKPTVKQLPPLPAPATQPAAKIPESPSTTQPARQSEQELPKATATAEVKETPPKPPSAQPSAEKQPSQAESESQQAQKDPNTTQSKAKSDETGKAKKPLPPTGLPMVESSTSPAEDPVNEEEYD